MMNDDGDQSPTTTIRTSTTTTQRPTPMTVNSSASEVVGVRTAHTNGETREVEVPKRAIHPTLRESCADLHSRLTRFLSTPPTSDIVRRTQEQSRIALRVIDKALQDYGFDHLSISYNGGKDCQVLLIIYLAGIYAYFTQPFGRSKEPQREEGYFPSSVPSVYAKSPETFDAITEFVEFSTEAYHLDLTHISTHPGSSPNSKSHSDPPAHEVIPIRLTPVTSANSENNDSDNGGAPIKTNGESVSSHPFHLHHPIKEIRTAPDQTITFRDAFALYLRSQPHVQAIFVGTRRTDPHGKSLTHFDATDGNWPRFMRVHPVIDWKLSEVWCFLRSDLMADPVTGAKLRYCLMYDEGYTSLGGVDDTQKNPQLKVVGDDGVERYRPAHELTHDAAERLGRV